MENEVNASSNIKTWIIVGVVALITFILVFVITNKIINGNKKKTTTPPTVEVEKYDAYKVGDEVTLKDGSTWHVLYESKDNTEYLTLLGDEDVNKEGVLYGNVNSYLKGTYKNGLVKSLGCQSTDIQEIRLLAYLDLADISKANSGDFLPDTDLSKYNFPEWITAKATVTDTVYQTEEKNSPVLICTPDYLKETKKDTTTETNNATTNNTQTTDTTSNGNQATDTTNAGTKFCLGDSTISLPVRPVLVISKKILKTNTTNSNKIDNSTNNVNTDK